MLDFPGRTACIVWLSGCNMRCAYCHNPQIIRARGQKSANDVLAFLKKRGGLLDGVVISGGEASIWPGLPGFIVKARGLGYAVKLDTNGLRPDAVKYLLGKGLLDYIALDYKAPPEKFRKITGTKNFSAFSETLDLLCRQAIVPFEVRTTIHTDLLEEKDIAFIMDDLANRGYAGTYYLQNFRADDDRPTLKFLPPQKRILNPALLPHPRGFQLAFRNFESA